ncbi:uncharacterized protein LOC101895439 [Musca domestica]|uniref:Uncharacterized protein LOC101895439 n=1 Tax=Musca domestica TaxID=7370 RepID=A0A1I8MCC0_MUSDO|nr:uncharacterized protein LOC101895439 [Musca domestica]
MKLFGLVVVISILCGSFAAVMVAKMGDPEHPGKCVYNGLILSPGESGYPEGRCLRVLCFGADGSGRIHTCGSQGAQPPCVMGDYMYPDAQYPKCCEKEIICPDNVDEHENKLF